MKESLNHNPGIFKEGRSFHSLILLFFQKNILRSILVFLIIGICSCVKLNTPAPTFKLEFDFPFELGSEGWVVGYSDYPVGLSTPDSLTLYQFSYGFSPLPNNIIPRQSGIMISGANRSDDLFMFMKKKITGLSPNTQYKITFSVELASNANTKAVGVGGGPGTSVFLKAGASYTEPVNTIDNMNWYRISIDKGNQSVAGKDMINIGNIGVSDTTTAYTLIKRGNGLPFVQRSGPNGELWLIIGSDSGFEGLTTLYYSNIRVTLQL
jgi:hypothetical protein